MKINVKKLVHPDGEDFCLWHPAAGVYFQLFCDDDIPPDPEWLGLRLYPESVIDPMNLRWVETGQAYDENGQTV